MKGYIIFIFLRKTFLLRGPNFFQFLIQVDKDIEICRRGLLIKKK